MDAEKIVSQMSLQEKIHLLCGSGPFTSEGAARLNVPPLKMADGPNGVKEYGAENICFPSASVLACSWDETLLQEVGAAIGSEAEKYGVDILLGPAMNLKRSPLCGRNFEYFSEDPVLSGLMAAAYVRGVQSRGVCACVKHFAVNNQENRRMSVSAEVDERTLRETYLKNFELAIRHGRPKAVMSAYNKINGTYCSQNRRLLTDILRGEWGFDGAVISDWTAVEEIVGAVSAGLDIDMPGNDGISARSLENAVQSGQIGTAVIDAAAARVVKLACRRRPSEKAEIDSEEICLRAAAESMVLLKNDGVLPICEKKSLFVVGEFAEIPRIQGGGSANVNGAQVKVSPLTAIGYYFRTDFWAGGTLTDEIFERAARADEIVFFAGLDETQESEGYDRTNLDLPETQKRLLAEFKRRGARPVVILFCGSAIETEPWEDCASAILYAGYAGQRAGEAIALLLSGRACPCGKLAETFPIRLEDTPAFLSFGGGEEKVRYGEGPFIGYKYYGARKIKVSYPFGFGLSYSAFSYSDLSVKSEKGGAAIEFSLTNVGECCAKEIAQIYVGQDLANRPKSELKAFCKVALRPGETKRVKVFLPRDRFEIYSEKYGKFVCLTNEYKIRVAASCKDVRLEKTLIMQGDDLPCRKADKNTLVGELLDREDVREMVLKDLLPYIKIWFTGTENGDLSLNDPFVKNMVENMPLRAFAYFSRGRFDEESMRKFIQKING